MADTGSPRPGHPLSLSAKSFFLSHRFTHTAPNDQQQQYMQIRGIDIPGSTITHKTKFPSTRRPVGPWKKNLKQVSTAPMGKRKRKKNNNSRYPRPRWAWEKKTKRRYPRSRWTKKEGFFWQKAGIHGPDGLRRRKKRIKAGIHSPDGQV